MVEKYTSTGHERQRSREFLADKRRIVVKIGSGSIFDNNNDLQQGAIVHTCQQIDALMRHGHEIVLVSSGAVAMGHNKLNQSPGNGYSVMEKRMLASIGQADLISLWDGYMSQVAATCQQEPILVAQVLPTHSTLDQSVETFKNILAHRMLPVVNYNDPLDDYEMNKYAFNAADNDYLARHLATELRADALVILTNTPGVLDTQNRTLAHVTMGDPARPQRVLFGDKSEKGTGGMRSKVRNTMKFAYGSSGRIGAISEASSKFSIIGPLSGQPGTWTTFAQPAA